MRDTDEFEALELSFVLWFGERKFLGVMRDERKAELLEFFERHACATECGKDAEHARQRADKPERDDDVAGERTRADLLQRRQQKQDHAKQCEKQQLAPSLGEDEADFGGHIVAGKPFGRGL